MTSTLRRLLGLVRPHAPRFALAVIGALVGTACALAVPLVVRRFVNDVLVDGKRSALLPLAGVVLALGLVRCAANIVRRQVSGTVAVRIETDLRERLFRHLQGLPVSFHQSWETGQLLARATGDLNAIRMFLSFGIVFVGILGVLGIGVLVALALLDPLLGLVVLVLAPLLVAAARRFDAAVAPDVQDSRELTGAVASTVEEAASGVRVVKAFGREDHQVDRLRVQAEALRMTNLRVVGRRALWVPLVAAIPNVMVAATLAVGGVQVLRGRLDVGGLVAAYTYLGLLAFPLRNVGWVLTMGQQAEASAARVFEVLDTEAEVRDRPGARALDTVTGRLEFDHVTVRYDDGPAVLDEISLTVQPGECVAIVGASGSGKSTLAALLSRFLDPTSGVITLDGHPLPSVTLHSLRSQVGVVLDEAILFAGTVRDNVAFGRPDAADEEVAAAAEVAGATGFVAALPDGWHTVVGENGLALSGGQRQRLALARALLCQPRILVLDDPLSAVDPRTEAVIEATLAVAVRGRTTLLIAHRASTVSMADRVVVLDRGRVVATGRHEELVQTTPLYRALLTSAEADHELALAASPVLDVAVPR